ncbi:MAG: MBL fold metallo-hydrolase [Mogibacterium sp.]|nr:MBL fold metallo-hydrolase [Mogibacterium sp.]
MKITILVDNNDGHDPAGAPLKGEWGLSFYIEYNGRNILLDAGLSGLFAENAAKLGIDLGKVDYAVLSHAHDDHANGMDTFFELNSRAPLYVADGCEENCYDFENGSYRYAGIPRGILSRHRDRIIRACGDEYIDEGIRLLGHTTPELDKLGLAENMFLLKETGEDAPVFIPDDFSHEQSLVFELPEGIVIFNSCSHAGADNIVNEVTEVYPGRKVLAMIGGFHLFNKTDDYVRAFASRLGNTGAESIVTGHCTGDKALGILKEILGDKVIPMETGLVLEIR